jgi:hypothetical protein
MNGRYRIPIPDGWDKSAEEIPQVARLLKSLDLGAAVDIEIHDEPLDFVVGHRTTIESVTVTRYVEVCAAGGKPKRHKPARPDTTPPAKLTAEQIAKRLSLARDTLVSSRKYVQRNLKSQLTGRVQYNWRNGYSYDRTKQVKRRAVGRAVSVLCARHGKSAHWNPSADDYAKFERLTGIKPEKLSKLRKHDREKGYVGFLVSRYADGRLTKWPKETVDPDVPPAPREPTPIEQVLLNAVEVEYWEAMAELV